MPSFKFLLQHTEAAFEVVRQGNELHITHNGRLAVVQIIHQENGFVVLAYERADGTRQQIRAAVHKQGEQRQAWVNGRLFTYQRVQQRKTSPASSPAASLAATIPAVVSQILVQPGDSVQTGDKLILLESMKMVIPIQAPYDGLVRQLHCQPGDAVQPGIPLITLDELPTGS